MTYVYLGVLVGLSILMAVIMRALPARWNLPFTPNTNPAPFYSAWGIGSIITGFAIVGIITWQQWWQFWVAFSICYPAIHWGFQRPAEKKMIEPEPNSDFNEKMALLSGAIDNLEEILHGQLVAIYHKLIWKMKIF